MKKHFKLWQYFFLYKNICRLFFPIGRSFLAGNISPAAFLGGGEVPGGGIQGGHGVQVPHLQEGVHEQHRVHEAPAPARGERPRHRY
jgi:hypothetical protein